MDLTKAITADEANNGKRSEVECANLLAPFAVSRFHQSEDNDLRLRGCGQKNQQLTAL